MFEKVRQSIILCRKPVMKQHQYLTFCVVAIGNMNLVLLGPRQLTAGN